jgi:hypothetical protein
MNDDLSAARAQLASARETWHILGDKLRHMDALARSKRLEHDEMIQLAYQYRSVQVAQGRAMDDAKSWRRVVARLEGRDPDRGPVALAHKRTSSPGYLASTTGPISRPVGPISLRSRGSINLGRTRTAVGPGYLTRMLGSS